MAEEIYTDETGYMSGFPPAQPVPLQTQQKLNASMGVKVPEQSGSVVPHGVVDPRKTTPLDEKRELTPAEKRMLKLFQNVRQFVMKGMRRPVSSEYAGARIAVEPNKAREHKLVRREMQQASRKANRGTKGGTKRKGQQ
jgi:hypothetical protein